MKDSLVFRYIERYWIKEFEHIEKRGLRLTNIDLFFI